MSSQIKPFSVNAFYNRQAQRVRPRRAGEEALHCSKKYGKHNGQSGANEEAVVKWPKAFCPRLLGPTLCWKTFYRQSQAFEFAKQSSELVFIFAFESATDPTLNKGQRKYLATSIPVFWHYYSQLAESKKAHYEIIPEGSPCKLYFDLEFDTACNLSSDGIAMTEVFMKFVCSWMSVLFDITVDRSHVLDLDASTARKFSRHLIFQLPDAVFENNVTVGHFVHYIMDALLRHVERNSERSPCSFSRTVFRRRDQHRRREAVKGDEGRQSGNNRHSSSPRPRNVGDCPPSPKSQAVHDDSSFFDDFLDGQGDDLCLQGDSLSSSDGLETRSKMADSFLSPQTFSSPKSTTVHPASSPAKDLSPLRVSDCPKTSSQPSVSFQSSLSAKHCVLLPSPSQNKDSSLCQTCRDPHASSSSPSQTKDSSLCQTCSDPHASSSSPSQTKDSSLCQTCSDAQAERVHNYFSVEELRTLFVWKKAGSFATFCDTGVYTRNRNFRLYLSSKLNKNNPLQVATENLHKPPSEQETVECDVFYASLVSYVRILKETRFLSLLDLGMGRSGIKRCHDVVMRGKGDVALKQEILEGWSCSSPYPEVDAFFMSLISGDGFTGGSLRRWTYFTASETLVYDVMGYRYCSNIGRQHRSNNIMYVADLRQKVFYQKCYDPECQAEQYRSPESPLPANILPGIYFKDDDFDDDLDDKLTHDLNNDFDNNYLLDEGGFRDTEDQILLEAVEDLELKRQVETVTTSDSEMCDCDVF